MLINMIIYFVNITTPVESPSLLVLTLSRKVRQISSCASIEIMAEETVKYFTLKLNYLQFETVRNLFNHLGWDFEDCVVGPNKSFETNVTNENLQENAIGEPRNEPTSGSHDESGDDDGGDDDGDNFGNNVDQNGECEHYFLTPCVTENKQLWLARPHIRNSELRKAKYKQFWKMMDREGAWKLQKYIQKKSRLLGDNVCVWTLREIMPLCVVNLVRSLYPNPQAFKDSRIWAINGGKISVMCV